MFRPSSSSPPHSPQHEEEVSDADNLEAELRHQRGNSHVIVTSPNRESTSDCESSGLPEDAMIPLSGVDLHVHSTVVCLSFPC